MAMFNSYVSLPEGSKKHFLVFDSGAKRQVFITPSLISIAAWSGSLSAHGLEIDDFDGLSNFELSSVENPCWLMIIGDLTTPVYWGL